MVRAWRGEIGLYRAAYGLGGLGLALVSLAVDGFVSYAAVTGGAIGWLSYIVGALGELAFAWISIVATWRAARKSRASGNRTYGWLAVSVALLFVGTQFVLIAGWTGWSGLAGLGFVPDPDHVLFRALEHAMGDDLHLNRPSL